MHRDCPDCDATGEITGLAEIPGGVDTCARCDGTGKLRQFSNLGGENVLVRFQGGTIVLAGHGCPGCGHGFWTEDDDARRLPEGMHPCPYCHEESEIVHG